jgi:dihydrofolate reductase
MRTWLDGPEAAGFFRVTRWAIDAEAWRQRLGFKGGEYNANSEVIAETFDSVGAYVMGRRMADGGEIPWGDDPPFRAPVFVVTSRPRQTLQRKGGTSFTYITAGIHSAIEQARTAANGKNVAIAGGGTLLRQVIKLGEDVKRSTAGARLSSTTEDETTSPPLPKPTARQLQPRPT